MPVKCITCNLKRATFNLPDEKKALYCGDCKEDGMIDVINKKCITCNLKIPHFNLPDQKKGLYCGDCKKDGMIDVKNKKCIGIDPLCDQQAKIQKYCSRCYYSLHPDKHRNESSLENLKYISFYKKTLKI